MHRLTLSILILSVSLLTACKQKATEVSVTNEPKSCSSKSLNADIEGLMLNPAIFDHCYVQVRGYLNIEAGQNGLYLDKEDYKNSMKITALWIDSTAVNVCFPNFKQLSGKYVLMEGKFNTCSPKNMSKWGGKLTDIRKLELWDPTK